MEIGTYNMGSSIHRDIKTLQRDYRHIQSETPVAALSTWLSMPKLVACWDMRSVDAENKIADHSGQGRSLEVTGFSSNNGIRPYISLANTEWLFRWAETGIATTGQFTFAMWIRQSAIIGGFFACRWNILNNQRVWDIGITGGGILAFSVSSAGTAATSVTILSTKTYVANNWAFVCGKFIPNTEMSIFHNMTKTSLLAGVPASAYAGYPKLEINGRDWGTGQMHAFDVGITALYAYALSDASINQLFMSSHGWYGV